MNDAARIKIVSGIDIVVTIFILITGMVVVIFGFSLLDLVNMSTGYYGSFTPNPFAWLNYIPWIAIFVGFTTLIYGVKRMTDDIAKISIS